MVVVKETLKMKYKFLEHTADVKFQSFGDTLEKAFENAVLALKEVIVGEIKVKGIVTKKIKLQGKDNEALLYNFLEEFLFLLDAEDFLLNSVKNIKIEGKELVAEIVGDKASNYKFSNDVKAITYNEMFVKQERDKFICQIVVDV